MSTGDLWYWLGWALLGVLNVVLIYLAWWSLFANKARGRRRCPRCWYDLAYAPGMMCSECGYVARSERDFGRTRRRYLVAMLSISASVMIAAFVNDRVSQLGWSSIVPTKVMILALPLAGGERSAVHADLLRRANTDQLSEREWAMLMSRCVKGDWWHEAPSEAWSDKYAPFVLRRRRLIEFYDDLDWDPEIEKTLLGIPPRFDVTTRRHWPDGSPFQIRVDLREWWPGRWDCRITAKPATENADPLMILRRATRRGPGGFTTKLPWVDGEIARADLDVTLERRPIDGGEWEHVQSNRVALETRFGGTIDEAMQPVTGEIMDAAVRQTFGAGAVRWKDGPSPVRVNFSPQSTYTGDFKDVAIGARIELLCDGVCARVLDIWWLGGVGIDERLLGWVSHGEVEEILDSINSRDGRWQMRVTGLPEIALRVFGASSYWSGSFTVPLQVTTLTTSAPPVLWSWSNVDPESPSDSLGSATP